MVHNKYLIHFTYFKENTEVSDHDESKEFGLLFGRQNLSGPEIQILR